MNKTIILFLVVLLTACSVNSVIPSATEIPSTSTSVPNTYTPAPPTFTALPTSTLFPSPTPTNSGNLLVIENEEPNLEATALNFQIDEYVLTMTAAADQILTLQAQQSTLEVAATSSSGQSSGSSGSSTTNIFGYPIPANVNPATIIDDAFLEIKGPLNPNGVPIMQQYMPQIHLYPGTPTYVYDDFILTDGGGHYYEVYDPDGQTIADFYLRSRDIQIKLRSGHPDPMAYPADVVKAVPTHNVIAYYVDGYDEYNKPIMEALSPRISWGAGEGVLVHGARVNASGNIVYYAVYDPDGKSSIYIIGEKLEMLNLWD